MKTELSMEFTPEDFLSDKVLADSGAFDVEEVETYNDYDLVTDLHLLHETLKDLKANGVQVEVINGKLILSKGETTISKWI